MVPYYEEAAHLLCHMIRNGLILDPRFDARTLILKIAAHIHVFRTRLPTHIEAATGILKDLEDGRQIKCQPEKRAKLLAVIGTVLSNYIPRPGKAKV